MHIARKRVRKSKRAALNIPFILEMPIDGDLVRSINEQNELPLLRLLRLLPPPPQEAADYTVSRDISIVLLLKPCEELQTFIKPLRAQHGTTKYLSFSWLAHKPRHPHPHPPPYVHSYTYKLKEAEDR